MVEMKILSFILSAFLIIASVSLPVTKSEPYEDKEALLDFIRNIHYSHSPNWDTNFPACFLWTGVTCNSDNSRVVALRLPGMGLRGSIPSNTLSRLSSLQILSLRSNAISGDFPSDFSNLRNLTSLYLQSNNFTGSLPSDFSVWNNLTVLDLSGNRFEGSIPPSISKLNYLTSLNLSNNSLTGEIPDINIPSLQQINLTNNHLTGILPNSLMRYPSSAFSGNELSSQIAIPPATSAETPIPQPVRKSGRKLTEPAILGIVLGSCVLAFAAIALLMICSYSSTRKENKNDGGLPTTTISTAAKSKDKGEPALKLKKKDGGGGDSKNNRLVFFEGCSLAFDLEDLLRASAEVLGKGSYGTTYKAALEDATTTVVVKRLKEVGVGKKEFEGQMEVVGGISHENVCALRAYYYSKDEKLMVYDFYDRGSVSVLLHGKRGEGRTPLDWETRMRIAIGAARGILCIHSTRQSAAKQLVHGNIKASNIFLNSDNYGSISDVGLATLMTPTPAPAPAPHRASTGYRAPEVTDPRKATPASDVYSFGVLLLELLTGKSPTNSSSGGEEVVHLVRWVNSVVREEWTAEVFDVELLRYPNIEEEMVEMLQIGMNCVVRMPDQRPKMVDVVKMVEGIRRAGGSVSVSPGDGRGFGSDSGVEITMSTPTPPGSDRAGSSSAIH
ncbi:unnamed protein product [Linum tenue]|uniref:Protein kinase domain-containing protein n=1 Tax=Linum tenue TaxID=586396 RepID=A0AAV0QPN2_9ROSI|nr:unnamed protein product [Linum tenue]